MPAKRFIPTDAKAVVLSTALPYQRGADAELPQRVRILAWGENIGRTTKAKIKVGERTQACLSANQTATASERVPLDYEHQSVPGHPNFKPDPRAVAGFGVIELVPGDGVYLSAIEYTPNGQEFACNYPDVSAEAYLDKDGNLLFVRSVALTQYGAVAGMEFTEAVAACACLGRPAALSSSHPQHHTTMADDNTDPKAPVYRDALIKMLQLQPEDGQDDVSDEQIATALAAMAEAADNDGQEADANADPVAPPGMGEQATLSARLDNLERRNLIQAAMAAGKIIPFKKETLAKLPMVTLSAMLDELPAGQVPVGPSSRREIADARPVALNAEQKAVAAALGIPEKDFLATLA